MMPATLSLLFGAAALLAHMVAVPAALRLAPRVAPVKLHVWVLAMVHALQVAAMAWCGPQIPGGLPYWHGAILLGAGAISYLFVFSAVYKSVSLRILGQVSAAGGRRSLGDLERDLIRPEFADRVALLRDAGLIAEREGAYAITAPGGHMAARLMAVQRLFGVSRSGLY